MIIVLHRFNLITLLIFFLPKSIKECSISLKAARQFLLLPSIFNMMLHISCQHTVKYTLYFIHMFWFSSQLDIRA